MLDHQPTHHKYKEIKMVHCIISDQNGMKQKSTVKVLYKHKNLYF